MSGQQVDDLDGREADILETFEDLLCGVGGLWDEVVGRGTRVVGTTGQELKTGTANTVRNSNGASELYAEAMSVTQRVWMRDTKLTSRRTKLCVPMRRE